MKRIIFSILCFTALIICSNAKGQNNPTDLDSLKAEINVLKSAQKSLSKDVLVLTNKNKKSEIRISSLEQMNADLNNKFDSLKVEYDKLSNSQKSDKSELSTQIIKTNDKVKATEDIISSRSLWGVIGIVVLLIALATAIWAFMKKFKSGSTSIDEVKKAQLSLETAQENIRKAQEKMQEETIQLDNKLIDILSKQSTITPTTTESGEIDHSLALKVADEIAKIEMNLSYIDENTKGYKQLIKGIQRIKDNFKANDYEIVEMLGKPYNGGMKVIATFVTDEKLEPGQQIISRIIKPQVNYKQIMIQAAHIEVSQSE